MTFKSHFHDFKILKNYQKGVFRFFSGKIMLTYKKCIHYFHLPTKWNNLEKVGVKESVMLEAFKVIKTFQDSLIK